MPRQPLHVCNYCGSPLDPAQRFCSNCGSTVTDEVNNPTEMPYTNESSYPQSNAGLESNLPPPPPYIEPIQQSQLGYQPTPELGYQPTPELGYQPTPGAYQSSTPGTYQPPFPSYADPTKNSSRSVLRQMGCGLLVVVLIILALCGGSGYLAFNWLKSTPHSSTANHTVSNSTTNESQTQGTPKASAPVVTTLHTPEVVYASVQLSITDIQQAASFPEDDSTSTGIFRVNLSEKNMSAQASYYFYGDVMLLQLPDGTSVHPSNEQNPTGPAASIARTNWIDFPVSTNVQPAQVTLIIGKSTESQISIPLKPGINLTKYQPKTVTINQRLQPESAATSSWTITNVTTQTSYNNKQATKGNIYIVVALKADNSSSEMIYPFPNDTMRLQSGSTKSQPDATTLPDSIAAGQTNVQGECAFIMPDDNTDFTFTFSPGSFNDLTQQMTATFQTK
jgi:hypothetical protein